MRCNVKNVLQLWTQTGIWCQKTLPTTHTAQQRRLHQWRRSTVGPLGSQASAVGPQASAVSPRASAVRPWPQLWAPGPQHWAPGLSSGLRASAVGPGNNLRWGSNSNIYSMKTTEAWMLAQIRGLGPLIFTADRRPWEWSRVLYCTLWHHVITQRILLHRNTITDINIKNSKILSKD